MRNSPVEVRRNQTASSAGERTNQPHHAATAVLTELATPALPPKGLSCRGNFACNYSRHSFSDCGGEGQASEVADAYETSRQNMQQETAKEFVGIEIMVRVRCA